jgi:hypothetical protein
MRSAASSSSFSNQRQPHDIASSSAINSAINVPRDLSWTNHFIGKPVSLAIGSDRMPLSPVEQRALIMRPLELVKAVPWFFALHYPGTCGKRRRQQPLPPLRFMRSEYHPSVPVRIMFGFVAFVCSRLSAAPRNMDVSRRMTWRCAERVIDRVTRLHVRRVQVRLMRALTTDARARHCPLMRALATDARARHCPLLTRTAANAGRFSCMLLRITAAP